MAFHRLVGNEQNKRVLQGLLERRQLGGTFLFAGPAGVGKRQFALAWAKAANCLAISPGALDGCDRCAICRRIDEGTYGDVIHLVPDGPSIRIAQTRMMNDEVHYAPREGRQRFFLIEEADRLREEAANSLLKTLEEPPPTSTIILLTARPDSLLRTIRSRARRLPFAPLAIEELAQYLSVAHPRPAAEIALLARLAGGCPGAALSIDLSIYRSERRPLVELLDLLAAGGERYRILKAAEFMAKKEREEFERTLGLLDGLLRDLLLLAGGAGPVDVVNLDILERLQHLASHLPLSRLILWIDRFDRLRRQLRLNINRQIATEAVLLSLAHPSGGAAGVVVATIPDHP
jgi:DNA polymerase-3 subunit delta'